MMCRDVELVLSTAFGVLILDGVLLAALVIVLIFRRR
jgi:hypothetical protein